MEGGPVSDLVKGVSRSLTSMANQEFGLLWGFKDDMLTLKHYFDKIEAVLRDAEEKRTTNRAVDLWLKRLSSVTLKVEDVLVEISTEALLQRLHKKRGIKYRVRAFFSSNHNPLMFRVRIANEIKSIRRKLDAIASKISELELTSSGHVDEMLDRPLTPDSFENVIVGRTKEVEMVTRTICDKDIGNYEVGEIRVYCILGMGGSGKTTLAKLVYEHEWVNHYFELKIWIDVSVNFQVKEIINRMITFIDECKCTLTRLDLLQESLHKKLMGKKFLIILDDIWIEQDEKANWDALRATLSRGAEGSIVLITTRSLTTGMMMAKFPELQFHLNLLSIDDSWRLFKYRAFAQGKVGDDKIELKPIGMEIVNKCGGLPLAVKTLGSLMWSKSSISDWKRVKDNKIWNGHMEEPWVLPALMLSYDNLPPHIKRCFAYCYLFPRGYDMEKDVVVQLWIVNGFIPPRGEIDQYVVGDEIFNCLVWRSFFEVVKDKRYMKDRYRMHDLMHELAQLIMRDDCLIIEECEGVIIPNEVLHLSSSCLDYQFSPEDLEKLKSLRSIFMFGVQYNFSIYPVYLRVLYLCDSGLKTLPGSICKLKHLKYLNLSYSSIKVLPDSIIYLQNLQVLLLNFCYKLCKLPEDMRYMSALRLLEIKSCHSLLDLPYLGIQEIPRLPPFTRFHVGKKTPRIEELGDLNHFDGELEISGLENVEGLNEAMSAKLKDKTNLSALKLCWSNVHMRESKRKMFADDEKVLAGLKPNSLLKELSIYFFMGDIISANWMAELKNLVEVGFSACKRCERIPQLGSLPNLKVIKLLGMDSLVRFDEKDTSEGTNMFPRFDEKDTSEGTNMFPCLRELHIFMCPKLIYLPSNVETLKVLKLEECGALISLPVQSFKSLRELKISGCEHLSQKIHKYEGEETLSHIPLSE